MIINTQFLLMLAWVTEAQQRHTGSLKDDGSQLYVSHSGVDAPDCGASESYACRTLLFTIKKLEKDTVVNLVSSKQHSMPFTNCGQGHISLHHSVTLQGHGGLALLGCLTARNSGALQLQAMGSVKVTLKHLQFRNVNVTVIDSDVRLQHCTFTHSRVNIIGKGRLIKVNATDTRFVGETDCSLRDNCIQTGSLTVAGLIAPSSLATSEFFHTKSVMNLFESGLLLRLVVPRYARPAPSNNLTILVDNVTFRNNERAMTIQGPFDFITIQNSIFQRNVAMHAGAGILLLTSKDKLLKVINCTFESNSAGDFRTAHVRPPGDYFKVSGDEVAINSECCKGSISLIGKGGALRIQRGKVDLIGSRFYNNTARLLGGAVFLDREGSLTVNDSAFSNTGLHRHSTQGDILYSNGKVDIHGGELHVITSSNHISALQHSGEHWSITVMNLTLWCPTGHRLRVMNTSSYAVKAFVGLQRSYKLDQLSYFCESCPRNKYSTDRGFLVYQLQDKKLGYYTLMVNGKSPNAAFNGNYQLHDITCLECPYGGLCEQNIRSLPNFWGYHDGQRIRFSACPRGYCCSTAKCAGYNSCATHRTGRLCASCQAGYSEALFSARCVPDHQCGPVWIWVFFFGMGILYALFLLFQKDIRDFIFQRPENCSCGWSSGRKDNDKYSGDYSNEHRVLSEEAPDDTQPAPREENSRDTCSNHSDDRGQQQRRLVADCCSEAGLLGDGCSNTHTGEYFHMQTTQTAALAGTSEKTPVCDVTRTESPPEQSDTGATFLIILCYYFQDALLFNVQTVGGPRQSRAWAQARAVLLGLFKFRLEISHFVDNVCLVAGLSPWLKELAKGILVPYVILLFGVLFIANSCGRVTRSRDKNEENPFLVRLATGFQLCLLFTYQKLATTSFKLLNCVPIGSTFVLFIDGNVVCFSQWQWYIMAYAGICIVPFFAVLILGPGLLSDGIIGLPQFFVASLCPLPFLVYWIGLRLSGRRGSREQQERSATPHQQAVLKVLQGKSLRHH